MRARASTPSASRRNDEIARPNDGEIVLPSSQAADQNTVTTMTSEHLLEAPPPPDPHPEASQRLRKSRKQDLWLGSENDVVELRKRPFICKYYILEKPRLRHLWCCHNELGNIWTHIIAAVLTLLQFSWWARDLISKPISLYSAGIAFYFITSVVTFCISVFYHWKMCAEEEEFLHWLYLDQSSCLGVIVVGFFSGVPMGYHCFPFLQKFYVTLSFIVCLLMAVSVRLIPKERWDLIAFVIIGGSAVAYLIPAVHWLLICEQGRAAIGTKFSCQIGLTCIAAVLYTKYIPERFSPGKFDLIGNSHQLWHVAVYLSVALFADCLIKVNGLIENATFCL